MCRWGGGGGVRDPSIPNRKIQNPNFLNVHCQTVETMPRDMPQIFCRTPPPPGKIFGFVHASINLNALPNNLKTTVLLLCCLSLNYQNT